MVTVSDDAKPKMLKKQGKAELSRRKVCKSLPDEKCDLTQADAVSAFVTDLRIKV